MKNGKKYGYGAGYSIVREREEVTGMRYPYLSFPDLIDRYTEFLNEGLVSTYPFNKLVSEIESIIGRCYKMKYKPVDIPEDDPNRIMWISGNGDFKSSSLEGLLYIRMPKPKNYEEYDQLIKHLEHVLSAFGYFIAVDDRRKHEITIESKFGKDVTKDIKEHNDFLYHITPRMYLHKIAQNGLCPMSKNVYNFPARVYLFTDSILEKYKTFATELYMKKPKFYDAVLGNTEEFDKYIENGVNPKQYAIMKVGVDGIKSPIYIDPNFSPRMGFTALYTEGNISPKYVDFETIFTVSPDDIFFDK